jgi:hypothetical protein
MNEFQDEWKFRNLTRMRKETFLQFVADIKVKTTPISEQAFLSKRDF